MNINYKEAQFEFFPEASGTPDETRRPHFMAARFNLSIENLVISTIVSIMVVIFAFSLGVERGKRVALREAAGPALDAVAQSATPLKAEKISAEGKDVLTPGTLKAGAGVDKGIEKPVAGVIAAVPAKAGSTAVVAQKTGSYTVQVASYKSRTSAQKEAQALLSRGMKAFVVVPSKGQHVALCVGNFQKKEDANVFGEKLKRNYKDYRVRRL